MVRSKQFLCVLILFPVMLVGCGVDPGDVAAFESSRVDEAIPVGSEYKLASSLLNRLGYMCDARSGSYNAGEHRTAEAPSFLYCHNPAMPNDLCKLGVTVVVVPVADRVSKVVFNSDYKCH